jgi:hypothetical protein
VCSSRDSGSVQVDQEAIAKNKAKIAEKMSGKENGALSPVGNKPKTPFSLNRSSSLRPALSSTTNQLATASLSSAKGMPADMAQEAKMAAMVCSLENKDACLSCGS